MLFADLLPQLLVDAPECPDQVATQALVGAAIEWCRETLGWAEIMDPIILSDGQSTYDLDVPTDAQLVTVTRVWIGDYTLRSVTPDTVSQLIPDWQTAATPQPTVYTLSTGSKTISVYPTPANAGRAKMLVRACYAPTLAATSMPDEVGTPIQDALLDGARARLFAQPRKPWSDTQLAGYHRTLFENAKVESRIEELHGGAVGALYVAPTRPFGF